MADAHYPSVDTSFIIENIIKSGKVNSDSQLKVGNSTTFILNGHKPLHKKLIKLREVDGDGTINYMQATYFAIIFGFMGNLLTWCEDNRDWKEGGYFVRQEQAVELEENEEE